MFGNWLNGVDKQSKALIRVGVSALCWSIWRCRNDFIFNNTKKNYYFAVTNLLVKRSKNCFNCWFKASLMVFFSRISFKIAGSISFSKLS